LPGPDAIVRVNGLGRIRTTFCILRLLIKHIPRNSCCILHIVHQNSKFFTICGKFLSWFSYYCSNFCCAGPDHCSSASTVHFHKTYHPPHLIQLPVLQISYSYAQAIANPKIKSPQRLRRRYQTPSSESQLIRLSRSQLRPEAHS
jgi:hypothetical protein